MDLQKDVVLGWDSVLGMYYLCDRTEDNHKYVSNSTAMRLLGDLAQEFGYYIVKKSAFDIFKDEVENG